jgi:glycosyltransferase involved in cell wall biosynthesis
MTPAKEKLKILVLHDSADYGGHEIAFLRMLPHILNHDAIESRLFVTTEENTKLIDRIGSITSRKLRCKTWTFRKMSFESVLGYLRIRYMMSVKRLIAEELPDIVVLVHGRIENCVVPMLSVPKSTPLVSYVPMAHKVADMGRSRIGDLIRKPLYSRPDLYIVPSASVEAQLRMAGASGHIVVVANAIDRDVEYRGRETDGPSDGRSSKTALFIGRLEKRQKGLDALLAAIVRDRHNLAAWKFIFIGEGPDRGLVENTRDELKDLVSFEILAWTGDPLTYVANADVIVMPSRWEGVPLTMLEAMSVGTPILASNIDVFREYLPGNNIFEFSSSGLNEALNRCITDKGRQDFRLASSNMMEATSVPKSSDIFVEALLAATKRFEGHL